MDIPKTSNEMKQGLNSDKVVNSQTLTKQSTKGNVTMYDGVSPKDKTQNIAKQSHDFSRATLDEKLKEAQEQLDANNINLKFNVLEEEDIIQVEIIDGTGKTIRKIPDDELIKLSESLKKYGQGFLDTTS